MSSAPNASDEPAAHAAWPLAGSPEFAAASSLPREKLAARFERDLRRHVLEPWFPACVDEEAGGFFCGFDRRWRRRGQQLRRLEFQARQARTAARAALAFPGEPEWARYALHGLQYLRDVMRDTAEGGWFYLVDRAGQPLADGTKHAHGLAYLIAAFAEIHRATRDESALALAREAFEWLDTTLHDREHGGYHGWATRDGRPVTSPAERPGTGRMVDPLEHAIGLKDANVHSDLLEALTLLAGVWPDTRVNERLAEVYDVLVGKFCTPDGGMHYMAHADWTPVPAPERFGYPLQTAFRLPAAAAIFGRLHQAALAVARRMVDHALEHGWHHASAGFFFAGPGGPPYTLEGQSLVVKRRTWWVQTEGLKALLLVTLSCGEDEYYARLVRAQARLINREFLDRPHRGWFMTARSDLRMWQRLFDTPAAFKGSVWKDASHEGDMYLSSVRMLRGIADAAPIGPPA